MVCRDRRRPSSAVTKGSIGRRTGATRQECRECLPSALIWPPALCRGGACPAQSWVVEGPFGVGRGVVAGLGGGGSAIGRGGGGGGGGGWRRSDIGWVLRCSGRSGARERRF